MTETNGPVFGRMIPAMVTPFDESGDLDLDQAQVLASHLADNGADGLVVCGTTGESPTVFYPQKISLFEAVVEAVGGRIPIIANVGDNCTDDTVAFLRDVQRLDVDGFMAVVPYYNKPPQEGLYRHFAAIAQASELPILLYNIPGRCSVNMQAQTTLRLAHDFDNIVAVKEASGDMAQISTIIAEAPEGFSLYSGDDSATLDIMRAGGVGVISTIGNVAPQDMGRMVDLAAQGQWDEALSIHTRLLPLMNGLFETSNPILVKEALNILGIRVGGVRLPLIPATAEQSAKLRTQMSDAGVI